MTILYSDNMNDNNDNTKEALRNLIWLVVNQNDIRGSYDSPLAARQCTHSHIRGKYSLRYIKCVLQDPMM